MPGFNFNSEGRNGSVSISPLHVVIMFLITTFGDYLEVQSQAKQASPYKGIMIAVYVTLSIYALGLIAEITLQNQTQNSTFLPIIKRFTPLFGILVVVLLVLVLVQLLGLVAFSIWALLMVEAVRKSFSELRQIFLRAKQIITSFLKSKGNDENGSPNLPGREGNDLLPCQSSPTNISSLN